MMWTLSQLVSRDKTNKIAVRGLKGRGPGVLFLHGFRSDSTGTKAEFLAAKCAAADLAFTALDYRGHGQSSGHYTDFTIGDWLADVQQVAIECTSGPQVVVGSSLGGWLGLLLAKHEPDRVKALVGIAAAPDFTLERVFTHLTPNQQQEYAEHDRITDEVDYGLGKSVFTRRLIEESTHHRILGQPHPYTGPVHLLQGKKDEQVPWQRAEQIKAILPQTQITYFAEGDHRLARPDELAVLWETIQDLA